MRRKFITKYVKFFVTNCDNFITKCDSFYKMQRLLQIGDSKSTDSTRIVFNDNVSPFEDLLLKRD